MSVASEADRLRAYRLARRRCIRTGAGLLLLLAASTASSQVHLGAGNLVASLLIAALKAGLVGWVFMGLDRAPPVQRIVAAAGAAALIVLFGLSSVDFGPRRDETSPWQRPQTVPAALRQIHPAPATASAAR